MDTIRTAAVTTGSSYGPLQDGFQYEVRAGYTALVGPNNAGKSSILQLVYRTLFDDSEFGGGRVAFVPPDRAYVQTSIETGGRTIESWNNEMVQYLRNQPLPFANEAGPARADLTKLLLHENLVPQLLAINELLPRFGLASLDVGPGGQVEFRDLAVHVQGSGLRGLLPILAAITNPAIQVLLVDEPELSLEPRLQKELRDLLNETAVEKRIVVVVTHSHLMLNRQDLESTQVVTREDRQTAVRNVETGQQLQDVTFDLLGASTEDLFFPRNYLIVEGTSDQVIMQRVVDLLGASTIKVLSAQGVGEIRDRVHSVVRALVPLVVTDSPYAGRVVALIDAPQAGETKNVERLRSDLGDRLYELETTSIEEYIPASIFARAGRDRDADLQELERLRTARAARFELKRMISDALAAVIELADLDEMAVLKAAALRAMTA